MPKKEPTALDDAAKAADAAATDASSRRRFVVQALSGFTGAALLAACGDDVSTDPSDPSGSGSGGSGTGATGGEGAQGGNPGTGAAGGGTSSTGAGGGMGGGGPTRCTVYPAQTAGPFYLDLDLVRSDITEGKPGAPMSLDISVLSADGCTPIEGAAVEVWHCDAAGVYSGFPGQLGGLDTTGQKFLRGTQITGADGRVMFTTIYPGWYPGRTTHIHFKVHPTANTEVTSQLYFPEDVNAAVYTVAPYAAHGQKDTTNDEDGIAQVGAPPLLDVSEGPQGYIAQLAVTVAGA